MIYLDNAATTPMSAVAISAMTKVMQETHGNPSSIHGHGRQAGKLLREARQELSSVTGEQTSTYLFHFWWDRRQQYCYHWLLPSSPRTRKTYHHNCH